MNKVSQTKSMWTGDAGELLQAKAFLYTVFWLYQFLWMSASAESETHHTVSLFFNKYGHCSRGGKYFEVDDSAYTLKSTGGSNAHERLVCSMPFRSPSHADICLTFKQFSIDDCHVTLKIYASKTASGEAWQTLRCQDKMPSQLCTSSDFVTVVLNKDSLNQNKGYSFEIDLGNSNLIGELSENRGHLSSVVLLGIIGGVVLLVVLSAAALCLCCCKPSRRARLACVGKGGQAKGSNRSRDRGNQRETGNQGETLVLPSAPPEEEPPPPYVPPPPYEREFRPGREAVEVVYENAPMMNDR